MRTKQVLVASLKKTRPMVAFFAFERLYMWFKHLHMHNC